MQIDYMNSIKPEKQYRNLVGALAHDIKAIKGYKSLRAVAPRDSFDFSDFSIMLLLLFGFYPTLWAQWTGFLMSFVNWVNIIDLTSFPYSFKFYLKSYFIQKHCFTTGWKACVFGLWGSPSVKDVCQVLSFLKWEFKSECPREQNIKCFPSFINVARHYRKKLFNSCAHASAHSALPCFTGLDRCLSYMY